MPLPHYPLKPNDEQQLLTGTPAVQVDPRQASEGSPPLSLSSLHHMYLHHMVLTWCTWCAEPKL